jgi:predicted DNA-binding protein
MDKSIRMSEGTYNKVKSIAKHEQRTIKTVIERALEIYFTNPGKDYGKTIKQK